MDELLMWVALAYCASVIVACFIIAAIDGTMGNEHGEFESAAAITMASVWPIILLAFCLHLIIRAGYKLGWRIHKED